MSVAALAHKGAAVRTAGMHNLHRMIEEDISNQDLMRMSNISANIITKLRTGKYITRESGRHLHGPTLHARRYVGIYSGEKIKMINTRKLESELWESADVLRAGSKLTSNQYCMPVLGLIF